MRPFALLRALSAQFPARLSSSPVAPWPARSSFDVWLATELDALRCHGSYASVNWLRQVLDVAVATQKMTIESISNVVHLDIDPTSMEHYLEDVVELLDACNYLREKLEIIHKYINSMKIVLHCLEGRLEPNEATMSRARVMIDSCEAIERRCSELDKCGSGLRKLGEKIAAQGIAFPTCGARPSSFDAGMPSTQMSEVLNGSKGVALLACGVLGIALSFKSKRGLPVTQARCTTSWSSLLHEIQKEVKEEIDKGRKSDNVVLIELRDVVMASRNLRDLMKFQWLENKASRQLELMRNVEGVRKSCEELEEGIKPLEGRVNELYRHLISIRMALLGSLSKA